MKVWRVIDELEGYDVEYKNPTDGRIVRKVVREVNEDKFRTIRKRKGKLFRTKYCPVHHSILEFSEEDFAKYCLALWPGDLEDDVTEAIKDNIG